MRWRLDLPSGRRLQVGAQPGVMAILNVTPDSFSDGGLLADAAKAVEAGLAFAAAGAALLDVGGESTRPRGAAYGAGAGDVSAAEETARVLPVVEGIRKGDASVPIAVDTRKTEVARAALDAGADVLNLVTGLAPPEGYLELAASTGAPVVLNHCRGTPATTFAVSTFGDVVTEVARDLARARRAALATGVRPDRVLVDPGLGFGKDAGQNFALLGGLDRLAPAGAPVVVGASRKAFLGSLASRPPLDRLPESLGAVAAAALGAPRCPLLVRVHDVEETLRFLAVVSRALGP